MPLKIAYLLMRWLFELVVLMFRADRAKDAELLVLRHENTVLRRNAGRLRYEPADRARFTALAPFIPRRRWAGTFPVTPATLLARHRRLVARKDDTSTRRRAGRPRTVRSIARIAVRLADGSYESFLLDPKVRGRRARRQPHDRSTHRRPASLAGPTSSSATAPAGRCLPHHHP